MWPSTKKKLNPYEALVAAGHHEACTWPLYEETPPGQSFWGQVNFAWSIELCPVCKKLHAKENEANG